MIGFDRGANRGRLLSFVNEDRIAQAEHSLMNTLSLHKYRLPRDLRAACEASR